MGEGKLEIELIDKDKAINALIPIMCEHSIEEDVQGEIMLCLLNAPTVEAVPVVHCKDCTWWEDEHVLLSDGTKRPYTEEEKKNCPTGVTCDIGINVGSRCMVNPHITNLFRNADDYCSRADMRKEVE